MAIITLHVLNGPRAGHRLSLLPQQEATVGRSGDAVFELPDDATLSRIHFHLIHCRAGTCWIVDPGSANGTYVNGKRLVLSDVNNGDVIMAGTTTFGVTVQCRSLDGRMQPHSGTCDCTPTPTSACPELKRHDKPGFNGNDRIGPIYRRWTPRTNRKDRLHA